MEDVDSLVWVQLDPLSPHCIRELLQLHVGARDALCGLQRHALIELDCRGALGILKKACLDRVRARPLTNRKASRGLERTVVIAEGVNEGDLCAVQLTRVKL